MLWTIAVELDRPIFCNNRCGCAKVSGTMDPQGGPSTFLRQRDRLACMYCVSVILTSDECVKIQQAAAKQWPTETLSRSEIVRRYTMFGIQALKKTSADDQSRLAHQFQASMEASDERLKH